MSRLKVKVKVDGVPKDCHLLPFGRQIEYLRKLDSFRKSAKITWISIKRQSVAKAWKEFIAMFKPSQWVAQWVESEYAKDDSIKVYYIEGKV